MSSAAKLRKYGRGTATVAAAALVMTSFGPAAFASWDDAPQTAQIEPTQTSGTIGIVDSAKGLVPGDVTPTSPSGLRAVEPGETTSTGVTETNNENQGATLVYAGEKGQAIADVRLVLPNRFASGDILDLRLLDRSATEHSDGLANQNADTLVGFTGTEGVSVEVSQAMDPRTTVNADTDYVDTSSTPTRGNTETTTLPWSAGTASPASPLAATAPSAAPSFTAPSVTATNSQQGKDNLRLSVTNKSEGDPNAVWVVTIKGLKVDLGAKATPGELRLVPFLSNTVAAGNGYTASPWFYGNAKEDNNGTPSLLTDDTPREIGIYTVPAYVSPVRVSSTNNSIVADGNPQSIGTISVEETQPFALRNGTYTIDFSQSGADINIESANDAIKALVEGSTSSETVTNVQKVLNGTTGNYDKINFTVNGADDTKTSKITFSGIMLSANQSGEIRYNITGGSISTTGTNTDVWLANPAGTSTLSMPASKIYPDMALINWTSGNVPGTVPETSRPVNMQASFAAVQTAQTVTAPAITTTSGVLSDALPAGTYTVSNNGNTITGPGGAFTLTRTVGGNVFTGAVAGAGAATDSYTITNVNSDMQSFVLSAPSISGGAATAVSPALGSATGLPTGTYAHTTSADVASSSAPVAGDKLTNGGLVLTYTDADPGAGTSWVWRSNAATAVDYTITGYDGSASVVVANDGTADSAASIYPVTSIPGSIVQTGDSLGTLANLPQATYTVSADNNTITGGGITLQRIGSTNTFRVTNDGNLTAIDPGQEFNFANTRANQQFVVGASGAVTGVVGSYVTAVSGAQNITPNTYYVTPGTTSGFALRTGNPTTGTIVYDDVPNGAQFANTGAAGDEFTLAGLAAGQVFTVQAGLNVTVDDFGLWGVNQQDILAPLDAYNQLGTASSVSARVGGNNRYETAAKIAELWALGDKSNTHGKVKNAIIASGENFPDALSASYLSQRMGAPILLTMKGRLPADTIEALRDRQVDKVFIIGGNQAISSDVEAALRGLDTYVWDQGANTSGGAVKTTGAKLQVQRIGGGSRYTTNQLVNMYAAAWGGTRTIGRTVYKFGEAGKYTAIFARGDNFADALAAGVLTAGVYNARTPRVGDTNDRALPLVLTDPSSLSDAARDQVDNLDIENAIIVGSENAVSAGVKSSLEDKGLSTTRLGGVDRYFTASAVAEFAMRPVGGNATTNEYPGLGFLNNDSAGLPQRDVDAYLANGLKFPDALAASPWVGAMGDVLNLTMGVDALGDGTKDFLTKRAADVDRAVAVGLGAAVSTPVVIEANKLASSK